MKQSASLDTSFWINAHRAGLIGYVLDRYELHFTREVGSELSEAFESGRDFWSLVREGVIAPAPPAPELIRSYGRGERSAMNLVLERPGWIMLLDDRRPLEEALGRGLTAICSPSLVASLCRDGSLGLAQAHEALMRLASFNTVSPSLVALARAQSEVFRREKED